MRADNKITYSPATDSDGSNEVHCWVDDAAKYSVAANITLIITCDTYASDELELEWNPNPETVKGVAHTT